VDFVGIPIPDEGAVFLVTVIIHIAAGLISVAAGLVAMLSRKGGRVHVAFGRIYLGGIVTLFASMVVLAIIRWPHDNHLAVLGLIALVATLYGFINRRRRGADRWHILAMGSSYVVMLTAFYVDNGPFLPVWNLLPPWALWIIPSIVGAPLIARAIIRRSRRPPADRVNPSPPAP
jgi:uncharacterized membrane protein